MLPLSNAVGGRTTSPALCIVADVPLKPRTTEKKLPDTAVTCISSLPILIRNRPANGSGKIAVFATWIS